VTSETSVTDAAGKPSPDKPSKAKTTAIIAAVIGLIIATGVIAYFNAGKVIAAVAPIGWLGFGAVIAAQVILFVPLGLAWWVVDPDEPVKRSPVFMWGRIAREAASDVLPFSQVGGLVISARCAVLGGVSPASAFGSNIVDVTVEMVAQIIYTLIGIALLVMHLGVGGANSKLLLPIVGSVGVGLIIVVSFIATQRKGLASLGKFVQRLAPSTAEHTQAMTEVIESAYGKPLRLIASLALHLFAWFGGAWGTWLILDFMGHPLPFLSVVAIESLLFAARNAAFVVPSGLGVQEGVYALLGPLFGLPSEAALALSLLKRARDIAVGVPVLLSWQLVEGRRTLSESEKARF
jgi:putative membrane protein